MVLIGESGFTAQTNSATVSTLSLMILRSAPCWIAATVPAGHEHDEIAHHGARRLHGEAVDHADPARQFEQQDGGGDEREAIARGAAHMPRNRDLTSWSSHSAFGSPE